MSSQNLSQPLILSVPLELTVRLHQPHQPAMSPLSFWVSALVGSLLSLTTFALNLPQYNGLKVAQNGSILEVTFHNPNSAINLRGQDFQNDMTDLVKRLQADNETKAVVFKSDVPRFFCAHVDLLIPDIRKYLFIASCSISVG